MVQGLRRIDESRIEVPQGYRDGMNVSGVIYVDKALEGLLDTKSVSQVANVATLPGIVSASMAMPDIHTGYGFTIGGVAAFKLKGGVISPGGVGYDINCGVRLLRTNLVHKEVLPRIADIVDALYAAVPSGVGSRSAKRLTEADMKRLVVRGAGWAVEQGCGNDVDLRRTESEGCMPGADPSVISKKAYERGRAQQGTLGGGNHFLEVQHVDEIYDEAAANAFGLFPGQVTVMIHTGSRGFGHQVCTDFLGIMQKAAKKYKIELPERELACAPCESPEAEEYLAAMSAAANYAWANRQFIMHRVEQALCAALRASPTEVGMSLLYDVAHNIAKKEEHTVGGQRQMLVVHRKGATRAFPPGHPELPPEYRLIGQPVIIPGDMGRASFVLVGTERAMELTFGSTCHGAGRVMSRSQAKRHAKGRSIQRELQDKHGVIVRSAGRHTLSEEMPDAYKDISRVVDVVHRAGISRKVARLRPLGVVKG